MKEYALNILKDNNFMFIEPKSGVLLSLSKPKCYVENPTDELLIAVQNGTILDVTPIAPTPPIEEKPKETPKKSRKSKKDEE